MLDSSPVPIIEGLQFQSQVEAEARGKEVQIREVEKRHSTGVIGVSLEAISPTLIENHQGLQSGGTQAQVRREYVVNEVVVQNISGQVSDSTFSPSICMRGTSAPHGSTSWKRRARAGQVHASIGIACYEEDLEMTNADRKRKSKGSTKLWSHKKQKKMSRWWYRSQR